MHPKKLITADDSGKSQKRYVRNAGPNVTINNIVTIDPEKYGRSPSTSKLSEDTDYDRVKFLVEERARYWRDLKILYNDYTLVKLKQKELLDAEDNYVNQHCIEETIKLSNAIKLKIQAKCKDIIFITNLCGNSDVNRVVQSLADGEDIDSVLIKKQKKSNEMKLAEMNALKKKNKFKAKLRKRIVVKNEEIDDEQDTDRPAPSAPRKRRTATNEPTFLDSELHWCQYCNVFPPTIKKYLQHLHDESHKKKIKELKINESPWHKCLPEEQAWRTDSTDSVRVKAFNFFVPANGWFCQLCRSWMGDIHCAAIHLRSYVHNMNLKNFQEKFPKWKQGWLDERSKALEKTFECRKECAENVQEQQNLVVASLKKKEEPESSSDEENSAEPISRHRTSKASMWVPNQKAFERVRKETNPISSAESSLAKIKLVKKERPAFIGKMPLILSKKKIVVKELPQNTTEKITTSCAETDKLQQQQNEITEMIIRRNEEENEQKLKEFMRVAKKIKKGKKKRLDSALAAECYNETEFVPVTEPVDPIENLIGPPALLAQWEADANYQYHMRQFHHYNMTSLMMQMPQPQTFLLDPYHAIALHNQQYYNSTHMISNQYENFEIISMDDEQAYSQYMEFQNSPSSSPCKKMFSSAQSDSNRNDNHRYAAAESNDKRSKNISKPIYTSETADNSLLKRATQEDRANRSKRLQTQDIRSQSSTRSAKKSKSHVIQKPACLTTASSDLMPSFKETFLSNDNPPGYISTLLSSCADVKVVSTNEVYKKKIVPSKRRRLRKKKEAANKKNQEDDKATKDISKNAEGNSEVIETENDLRGSTNEDISPPSLTPSKDESPRKHPISLKDKINSIRKTSKRLLSAEESGKRSRIEENENICEDSNNDGMESERPVNRKYRSAGPAVEVEHRMRYAQDAAEDDSEEEEMDSEKLIFYDMTSI